ncbi:unnamed protein product [Schistosoma curassoni]|uniref:GSDH domain-containing protein n=1 Tax=Schistosoma curassoni TaxID=6186 RepID=A0A183JLN7_9TREM|nr:unnamed protein product [Schistosoma curassoni]
MMVEGIQQETLPDLDFVLFGTGQQGLPVILSELVLPDGFDPVSPSFTETLPDLGFVLFGTGQQGKPIILRKLVLPDGFDPGETIIYGRQSDLKSVYLLIRAK